MQLSSGCSQASPHAHSHLKAHLSGDQELPLDMWSGFKATPASNIDVGYSVVSPGVVMRHLEGPKNPDGLNLGIHIFIYVYKVHMRTYMLGGRMRSSINCFFLQHIFSVEK